MLEHAGADVEAVVGRRTTAAQAYPWSSSRWRSPKAGRVDGEHGALAAVAVRPHHQVAVPPGGDLDDVPGVAVHALAYRRRLAAHDQRGQRRVLDGVAGQRLAATRVAPGGAGRRGTGQTRPRGSASRRRRAADGGTNGCGQHRCSPSDGCRPGATRRDGCLPAGSVLNLEPPSTSVNGCADRSVKRDCPAVSARVRTPRTGGPVNPTAVGRERPLGQAPPMITSPCRPRAWAGGPIGLTGRRGRVDLGGGPSVAELAGRGERHRADRADLPHPQAHRGGGGGVGRLDRSARAESAQGCHPHPRGRRGGVGRRRLHRVGGHRKPRAGRAGRLWTPAPQRCAPA